MTNNQTKASNQEDETMESECRWMDTIDGKTEWVYGTLSTDHATSSYGVPVVVIDGVGYGPGDMPPRHTLSPVSDSLEHPDAVITDDWPGTPPGPLPQRIADLRTLWGAAETAGFNLVHM